MSARKGDAPPGAITTRTERRTASGHWLLAAAPLISRGLANWKDIGATWLRPGILFGAVSIPAGVVHAAVGSTSPQESAAPLAEVLNGGPVFYEPDPGGEEDVYTALIPAGAAQQWSVPDTVVHPYRALLQVPAPDRCAPGAAPSLPWWVVPVDSPGVLCSASRLAALVGLGREAVGRTGGGEA
ncbi:hypothetical protein [Streptomyces sp. NBC_01207]|uniref:hypothetical protein n=1 Tax=Streptomyces sp. NBC_01207 TaxID=2903772 RepID=UPI002E13FECF|nr:hypothetical protein OG457_27600 [Streptomyces sp. NBC_01207]